MSLRLEMLQVARLAPKVLGDATALVREFVLRQQNGDGGFRDRAGRSDLYYSVFAVDALVALEVHSSKFKVHSSPSLRSLEGFIRAFGDGRHLDFVHLCCLARAWAQSRMANVPVPALLGRLESFRAADGGYNPVVGSQRGTAYGCFLALGAYQDVQAEMPDPDGLVRCLQALATPDGAWTNAFPPQAFEAGRPLHGSTNATAAAVTVLRQLNQPVRTKAAEWLLARWHPQGGFLAGPGAPLPDLLSTATALHALAGMQVPLDGLRERCLDYLDSLWTNEGSFHAHWAEDLLDCEYTFYGLLALGHLSV